MDLVGLVYRFAECFPPAEKYGLTSQIRRAAVSVPSNIAEGRGRGSDRDYRSFVLRARGSLYEIETQAVIASRLGYVSKEEADRLVDAVCEACRIVNGLIRDLAD
jgi:four helix bundle protein